LGEKRRIKEKKIQRLVHDNIHGSELEKLRSRRGVLPKGVKRKEGGTFEGEGPKREKEGRINLLIFEFELRVGEKQKTREEDCKKKKELKKNGRKREIVWGNEKKRKKCRVLNQALWLKTRRVHQAGYNEGREKKKVERENGDLLTGNGGFVNITERRRRLKGDLDTRAIR